MKEGGVDASFFAIYTSNFLENDECTRKAFQMIASVYDAIDDNYGEVALAKTVNDARNLKAKGVSAVFLGMENGAPFQRDLRLLRLFYRLGIRYVTLTHAGNNEICDSCAAVEKKWGGVSPFGREVISEMNRLGMIVDVSHISDDSFYDVLKYSRAPVVATHSCCRALANHPRNMTDRMIKDLAAVGGVIQINFYPAFLNDSYAEKFWPLCDAFDAAETDFKKNPGDSAVRSSYEKAKKEMEALKRPSYKVIIDHVEHAVNIAGPEHVGLGSDFDGIETCPEGLEDISRMEMLTEEMFSRGFSEHDIKLILGENFLRVFSEVENLAIK
jgi:membrane dipeptidase